MFPTQNTLLCKAENIDVFTLQKHVTVTPSRSAAPKRRTLCLMQCAPRCHGQHERHFHALQGAVSDDGETTGLSSLPHEAPDPLQGTEVPPEAVPSAPRPRRGCDGGAAPAPGLPPHSGFVHLTNASKRSSGGTHRFQRWHIPSPGCCPKGKSAECLKKKP